MILMKMQIYIWFKGARGGGGRLHQDFLDIDFLVVSQKNQGRVWFWKF